MVNFSERKKMASATRRYIHGAIHADDFDDLLESLEQDSGDETVDLLRAQIQFDCEDIFHPKRFLTPNKADWDYFHRVLLLLESGGELVEQRQKRFSFRQLSIGLGYLSAGLSAWFFGIPFLLFPGYLLVALYLAGIIFGELRQGGEFSKRIAAMAPFHTLTEILEARRRVPGFVKPPCPQAAAVLSTPGRFGALLESTFNGIRGVTYFFAAFFCLPLFGWLLLFPTYDVQSEVTFPEITQG